MNRRDGGQGEGTEPAPGSWSLVTKQARLTLQVKQGCLEEVTKDEAQCNGSC